MIVLTRCNTTFRTQEESLLTLQCFWNAIECVNEKTITHRIWAEPLSYNTCVDVWPKSLKKLKLRTYLLFGGVNFEKKCQFSWNI